MGPLFYVLVGVFVVLSSLGVITAVVAFWYLAGIKSALGRGVLIEVGALVDNQYERMLDGVRMGTMIHGLKGPDPVKQARFLLAYLLLAVEKELRGKVELGDRRHERLAALLNDEMKAALSVCGKVSLEAVRPIDGQPSVAVCVQSSEHGWLRIPIDCLRLEELVSLAEFCKLRQTKKGKDAAVWSACERRCVSVITTLPA